jgi:ubiquinone/menaquinone biosynthesis C-methylase UbiE
MVELVRRPHSRSTLNTCCAVSYGHPLARWLLGDSFHPGGLGLTERLAAKMGIGATQKILDIGSGLGTTTVHLAKTLGCHVTGVTLEPEGFRIGRDRAEQAGVSHLVDFVEGDALTADLSQKTFDHVVIECVLSILPDKRAALERIRSLLANGGTLGMTDVTVNGPLPSELRGLTATAGCIGGAVSMQEYQSLLEDTGFAVEVIEDCRAEAQAFMRDITGKLMMTEIAVKLGKIDVDATVIDEAKRVMASVRELVDDGAIGYGMIVARK